MKFNTRINLKYQTSKKPQRVILVCRWSGSKLVYYTPFSVVPKNWNIEKGEIRNVIDEPDRNEINNYLKEIQTAAKSIYNLSLATRQELNKDQLKISLDKWAGKIVEKKEMFGDWVQSYIDDSPKRINPKTGKVISFRTIQEYNTTFKYLKDFEKENRIMLDFSTIEVNTLVDFRDYLTTIKGFALNNVAKHVDNLKQFLRAANDAKIDINTDVLDSRRLKVAKEIPQDIYLNENDLLTIEMLDFSDKKQYVSFERTENDKTKTFKVNFGTLDRVKDLFLIGCYTGLRVSDFNNLQPHNIKNGFIDIFQAKTAERIVIPINNKVRALLDKYGGQSPPKISDQKINLYIKEIARMAGITENVEKQQTKGGNRISTVSEKWQLVKSHTARRSFATNMVKNNMPIQLIMKITGHKKEDVFLKYVKLSPLEYAQILNREMAKGMNNLNND